MTRRNPDSGPPSEDAATAGQPIGRPPIDDGGSVGQGGPVADGGRVAEGDPAGNADLTGVGAMLPPLRSPVAIGGAGVVGFAMGVVEVVPGFSGATVALLGGVYERLVATIRQGARVLSLLLRGRALDAGRAFLAVDWAFAIALGIGLLAALITLAPFLRGLIEDHPVAMQAVFFGMVLGAAVVAGGRLRSTLPWHLLVGVAAAALTFVGLGFSEGTIADPSLIMIFLAAMVAVCAWILPGVSGAFVLLVLGVYPAVLAAITDRDLVVLGVVAVGCVAGLALFSTMLSWALLRAYDLVLSILVGIMVGSARVLWPWPAAEGVGSPTLGAPDSGSVFLAIALALGAFATVWMFGLVTTAVERRFARRKARRADDVGGPLPGGGLRP